MKMVLCSTNIAKINATKKVLNTYFENVEIVSLDTESGVSQMPFSDEEGITGCFNRIEYAKNIIKHADAYLGLEGIVIQNKFGMFICGWCVMEIDKKIGIGCSAKVQLPNSIASKINNTINLGEVVKELYPSEDVKELGTNGIITKGKYTRVNEFVDAITCALAYLNNPANQN